MSERKLFRLIHATARGLAMAHVETAPDGWTVELRPPRRTDAQSAKMHAMADDLSKQVLYMGMTLTGQQWKRFAMAKLKKDLIIFDCDDRGQPDARQGLVAVGAHTREESGATISAVIEWFYWFGAQHGVVWKDEAKEIARLEECRR